MVMAAAGWLGYYLSGAEVLLLDGNVSFIGVLSTLLALRISIIKTRITKTYPFGQFVYEPAYTLFIGLLAAGAILATAVGNLIKIIRYLDGEEFPIVDTSVIVVYTVAMVVLCFGLVAFFGHSNRKLNGNSTILKAYRVQSKIDGFLSAGAGGALILFGFASPEGTLGFLTQIGDAIVVLLLCLSVMYLPIKLVRASFVELSGGALDDLKVTERIRSVVSRHVEGTRIADLFISKTGSAYFVVAFMEAVFFDAHNSEKLLRIRREVTDELKNEFDYVTFEMTLAAERNPSLHQ